MIQSKPSPRIHQGVTMTADRFVGKADILSRPTQKAHEASPKNHTARRNAIDFSDWRSTWGWFRVIARFHHLPPSSSLSLSRTRALTEVVRMSCRLKGSAMQRHDGLSDADCRRAASMSNLSDFHIFSTKENTHRKINNNNSFTARSSKLWQNWINFHLILICLGFASFFRFCLPRHFRLKLQAPRTVPSASATAAPNWIRRSRSTFSPRKSVRSKCFAISHRIPNN